MIKAEKGHVVIAGNYVDTMAEFGTIVIALAETYGEAGLNLRNAKKAVHDVVEIAFDEFENSEEEKREEPEKKDTLDEVEDLLKKILETVKGGCE